MMIYCPNCESVVCLVIRCGELCATCWRPGCGWRRRRRQPPIPEMTSPETTYALDTEKSTHAPARARESTDEV